MHALYVRQLIVLTTDNNMYCFTVVLSGTCTDSSADIGCPEQADGCSHTGTKYSVRVRMGSLLRACACFRLTSQS